jgi:hypothetical protein
MTLSQHVEFLVNASLLMEKENKVLQKKHGLDDSLVIELGNPKVWELAFDEREEEKKAEDYLDALDDNTIQKIQALMYFGRNIMTGINETFNETLDDLSGLNETKSIIIHTILEKSIAYPEYFSTAKSFLKEQGIDIDYL